MADDDRKGAAPGLPPDAQARIGAQLRRMYDDVVQAPVPDRFASLLDQLESMSAPGETGQSGPSPAGDSPADAR